MFNVKSVLQLSRQLRAKPGKLGGLTGTPSPKLFSAYVTTPLPVAPTKYMPFRLFFWGVFGNNDLGDCTFAAIAHAEMAVSKLLRQKFVLTGAQVIASYKKYINKYMGGKDIGSYPTVVLQDWQTEPMWGSTIPAWVTTDHTDLEEWRQIISSYGALLISINLPRPAYTYQMGAHFKSFLHPIWRPTGTKDDDVIIGGHEMVVVGYDEHSFYAVTWGVVVRMTIPWIQKYTTQTNALVLPELVKAGKFDNVDVTSLIADLKTFPASP
jgi:hypothetical protein